MTVTFFDVDFPVGFLSFRSLFQRARVCPQTHGATFVYDALLFFHKTDNRMLGISLNLCTVGVFQTKHISSEFNSCDLHS